MSYQHPNKAGKHFPALPAAGDFADSVAHGLLERRISLEIADGEEAFRG